MAGKDAVSRSRNSVGRPRHPKQFCDNPNCPFCQRRLKVLQAIAAEGGIVPSIAAIARKGSTYSLTRADVHWLEGGGYLSPLAPYERAREITKKGWQVLKTRTIEE